MKGVHAKLDRAKTHIDHLTRELVSFTSSQPYDIQVRLDDKHERREYFLSAVAEVPTAIPLILGDVIHNLRGALDHLAYHLVMHGTSPEKAHKDHVYFPVAETKEKYEQRITSYLKGSDLSAQEAVEKLEAYKGGAGEALWLLSTLNNMDKHKLLLFVGAKLGSVDIGPVMNTQMTQMLQEMGIDAPSHNISFPLRPEDPMFPLKKGDVLYSEPVTIPATQELPFTCELVIASEKGQDGYISGGAINGMYEATCRAVSELMPFC